METFLRHSVYVFALFPIKARVSVSLFQTFRMLAHVLTMCVVYRPTHVTFAALCQS